VIAARHAGVDNRNVDQLFPQKLALMRAVNELA